jgi:diguanylate cyclase (GGDEF)-like protein
LLLAFALIPAAAIALALGVARQRHEVATLDVSLASWSASSARAIERLYDERLRALALAAASPTLADGHALRTLEWLSVVHDRAPGFVTVAATDADGRVVAAWPRSDATGRFDAWLGTSLADRAEFREPQRDFQPRIGALRRDRTGAQVVTLAAPIIEAGTFRGVVTGTLDATPLERLHEASTATRGFELAILDAARTLVYASPGFALDAGRPVGAGHPLAAVAGADDPPAPRAFEVGTGAWYGLAARTSHGWTVVVGAPQAAVARSWRTSALLAAALLAVAALAALAATNGATQALTRPIQQLVYRLEAFSAEHEGADFDAATLELPVELVPIRDTLARTARQVRQSVATLKGTLEREATVREELQRVVAERENEVRARTKELEVAVSALRDQSLNDGLTGLRNFRAYRENLETLWAKARERGIAVAALALDVDHFKQFNDTYGHQAGDACLKRVGQALRDTLGHAAHTIARSGGEEFIALFDDADRRTTLALAERVRAAVEALGIPHTGAPRGHVTVSVGVSYVLPTAALEQDVLVRGADLALYRAKRSGRNTVVEMSPALLQRPKAVAS